MELSGATDINKIIEATSYHYISTYVLHTLIRPLTLVIVDVLVLEAVSVKPPRPRALPGNGGRRRGSGSRPMVSLSLSALA